MRAALPLGAFTFAVLLVSLSLGGSYMLALGATTPSVAAIAAVRSAKPSMIVSRDGVILASIGRWQQTPVPLSQISPYVVQALIATEDQHFYEHSGIDIPRTVMAAWNTLNGETQGGSTITQQLARNLFPDEIGRDRNVQRKLRELITAMKIERAMSKDEILETYLNTVPFLYNVVGIEMAARTYFSKSASQLGPAEAATLVGMLKGTYYYNPFLQPARSLTRRNVVLQQMVRDGQLTPQHYEALARQPLHVSFNRPREAPDVAPHFTNWARRWLTDWAERNGRDLRTEGLVIETTLDTRMQAEAEAVVARQTESLQAVADVEWGRPEDGVISNTTELYEKLRPRTEPFAYFWKQRPDLLNAFVRETPQYRAAVRDGYTSQQAIEQLRGDDAFMQRIRATKTRLEAGLLAMDPQTAEVRVWVGSRDFDQDQFDHVVQAARQPGSTFKPIVYGAALEAGISPWRRYDAAPVWVRLSDGRWWRPTDMAGHANPGVMTLRDALIRSRNTVTTRVMQQVGLPSIVGLARGLGVKHSPLAVVPSLALGTSPVTLFEMVSAYSSIARQGVYKQPVLISRIVDRNGQEVVRFGAPPPRQAMSRDAAVDLIDIMRGVVTQGTGYAIRGRFGITADVAGKTGTTQNNTDGWFILMHPQLVVGAWVGFNDARVTLRSSYWGQGGHNAIMLVGDFFSQALGRDWVDASSRFPRAVHAAPPPPPPPAFDDPPAAPTATDVPIQAHGGGRVVPLDMTPLQPAEIPVGAAPTASVSHLLDPADLSAGRSAEPLP